MPKPGIRGNAFLSSQQSEGIETLMSQGFFIVNPQSVNLNNVRIIIGQVSGATQAASIGSIYADQHEIILQSNRRLSKQILRGIVKTFFSEGGSMSTPKMYLAPLSSSQKSEKYKYKVSRGKKPTVTILT